MILLILLNPDTYVWIITAILGVLSLAVFFLCRWQRRWYSWAALAVVMAGWYVFIYGTFAGFSTLEVRQIEFASKDLPDSFDGYRIVQFSDLHIGTYSGWREKILRQVIDSINAQKADLVVFTGDMQNKVPDETLRHTKLLSSIKAKDGVCSVLGNHDYPMYSNRDEFKKTEDMGRTCSAQIEMGWFLLCNSRHRISRGNDNIFIAGMENDGEGRFPQKGDISATLSGLNRQSFVVMLEHDPTSWRRKILKHSHCQLTLSGHTHGGQLSLFGLSPAQLRYRESAGMYYAGDRAMNVSTGVGGVVPIRFGTTPEIVVITLHKKH